jgi:hypothetical protein
MPNGHVAVIRDPQLKRLRALMMLDYKLRHSATHAQVGKEFNVSEKTVMKTLTWARRAGLFVEAEDKIVQELVPLAHKAIAVGLEEGGPEAMKIAVKIFEGVLPGFGKKRGPKSKHDPSTNSGDELAAYINHLRGDIDAINGEILLGGDEGEAKQLAAPTETPNVEEVLPPIGAELVSEPSNQTSGGEK